MVINHLLNGMILHVTVKYTLENSHFELKNGAYQKTQNAPNGIGTVTYMYHKSKLNEMYIYIPYMEHMEDDFPSSIGWNL